MASALDSSTLVGTGEEKKQPATGDGSLPSSKLTPDGSERRASNRRRQQDLPPVIVKKSPGQSDRRASTAEGRPPHCLGAGGEPMSSVIVSDHPQQQQQLLYDDPDMKFTLRESSATEESRVSSMLKGIGGRGGVPVTGKVVPIEAV